MIMKPVIFLLLVCFGVSSGLNINFGLNKMFDVFGYTSNDIADIMEVEDEEVPDNRGDTPLPPPHDQVARMARYITHNSDWAALATIATRDPIIGFPFANVLSISDGPVDNSTGVPYIYISPWEISARDLAHNNKASLTMSLAQVIQKSPVNFWLRQEPKESLCPSVRPSVTSLSRALNLHLSGSNLQAISQSAVSWKSVGSQLAVTEQLESNKRAIREQIESTQRSEVRVGA